MKNGHNQLQNFPRFTWHTASFKKRHRTHVAYEHDTGIQMKELSSDTRTNTQFKRSWLQNEKCSMCHMV